MFENPLKNLIWAICAILGTKIQIDDKYAICRKNKNETFFLSFSKSLLFFYCLKSGIINI